MNPFINDSNCKTIINFVKNLDCSEMQGNKLKALFKLIDLKGEAITTEYQKLKGLKALRIKEGLFVAMKRTAINGNFYPCKMETYLLETTS